MIIAPGTTSLSVDVQIVDDAGLPVTGLVAATFPALSYSLGTNTAATNIVLSDLAAITTAYTSGGVKERSGGWYRLDVPNAALAASAHVTIIGDASGKHLIAPKIDVQYVQVDVRLVTGIDLSTDNAGQGLVNVGVDYAAGVGVQSNLVFITGQGVTVGGGSGVAFSSFVGDASQASVNAIPTNPLLANDARLPVGGVIAIEANATTNKNAILTAVGTPQQTGVAVTLPTVDGISMVSALEAGLALAAGKMSIVDNGNGSSTATFYKQNGTSPKLTVTYNPTSGARSATSVS